MKKKLAIFILLLLVLSGCIQKSSLTFEGKTKNWESTLSIDIKGRVDGEISIRYIGSVGQDIDYFEYELLGQTNKISQSRKGNIHMPLEFKDSINSTLKPKDGGKYDLKIKWNDKIELLELYQK
ncbi:hypothetical protein ACFQ3W_15225 [Paenibacillus puldeungensis]|uniref:Lipoprotein n=1 Tax=Paenibacillus puldeungensis TaxID=696536 RepID=A0ABW3RZI0_9BACL